MRSSRINGEGELRGQPANPGSPGKMVFEAECVCMSLPVLNITVYMQLCILLCMCMYMLYLLAAQQVHCVLIGD